MNRGIKISKNHERNVEAVIKFLDIKYLDKIIELEKTMYDNLENKEYYCCSSREEFTDIFLNNGKIVGCVIDETDELVAIGVYVCRGYDEHNYGYDFNIKGEELLKVGQIESTVVSAEYRGNGLQNLMYSIIEDIAKENGNKIIAATVAPGNVYSLNTFKKRGYEIMADKLKYGGLRRYVVMKEI